MAFIKSYFVNTTNDVDILSIIHDVRYAVRDSKAVEGLVTVIVPGAGASVMIFEPIEEVKEELKIAFELFAGEGGEALNKKKEKISVSAHVQATTFGRQISIPLSKGKLVIDPYEDIFLIDFEKKSVRREFLIQVLSEAKEADEKVCGGQVPKQALKK